MDTLTNNNYHKQKCEELRKIRVKMADTLGVPDVVRKEPCNFKGECKGTCPACYMEEKALMERIYELAQDGRMNMLFGEDIKVLSASAFDDILMGEDEVGDVEEYDEDFTEFDEEVDTILNSFLEKPSGSQEGLFDDIEVPAFELDEIVHIEQPTSAKIKPLNESDDTHKLPECPRFEAPLPGMIITQPWMSDEVPKPVDKDTKKKGIKIPWFIKGKKNDKV